MSRWFLFFFALNLILASLAQAQNKSKPEIDKSSDAANRTKAETCALKNKEKEWLENTLALWQTVSRDFLRLKPAPLPWLVLFDETCVWYANPNLSVSIPKLHDDFVKTILTFDRKSADVYGIVHEGNITLPDGQQIPPQLMAFAATYDEGKKPFLVSAMPAIWQKAPHLKAEVNLNALIRSVFIHEMTHTRHQNFFDELNRIEKRQTFPEGLDDDIVQNRFGKNEDFRKAFEVELDLLYQSAFETDKQKKGQLAKNALEAIQSRRQQYFVGNNQIYTQVEDIFLTMEGAANWAAYRSAISEGMSETDAVKLIRRGGRKWSQDEGLALFLILDSLLPDWQKKVFGKSAVSVTSLLREVVR